jgi:osmotically-inducible protein OsmY
MEMFNFFRKKDPKIQQDVVDQLSWEPRLDSNHITVTTKDGMVTLSGSVPHYFEKYSAEQAALRVGGVRSVNDELKVDLLESYTRTDDEITKAANEALKWNYEVPDGVAATVDNGWITLTGVADWDYQRRAAREAVISLMGVYGVSNDITLNSKVMQFDIKLAIEDALKRSAETEANEIKVSVKGSTVTLSGNVNSYAEMEDARLAAWSAPGVSTVENNLQLAA